MKEKIVALTQEEVLITISAIRDKISDIQEALREVQKKKNKGGYGKCFKVNMKIK